MSVKLGQDWLAKSAVEVIEPPPPSEVEVAMNRILVGLLDLKDAITAPLPAPVVQVEPPDLSEIVMAVNGLKPGATADDIATAIASKLTPTAQTDVAPVLEELVKRLETLDFRQLGMGRVGGGTVALTAGQTVGVTGPVSLGSNFTKDSNNSTTTALTAGQTFTGTATDLTNYAELVVQFYGTPSTAQASFFFEFSPDGINWDVSVPSLITDPTFFIPNALIPVAQFFRVRYLNDGGVAAGGTGTPTTQTAFRLNTYLCRQPTKEIGRTLAQTIADNQPAILTRSVLMGKDPDGSYANLVASGADSANSTTALLAANATFTGTFVNIEDYSSIGIVLKSDVASATSGVVVDFSNNGTTTTTSYTREYTGSSVAGGEAYAVPALGRFYRVRYINGGTNQASFTMMTILRISRLETPSGLLEAVVSDTNLAAMGRNLVMAKNPSGTYGNIQRSANGGLITAVEGLPSFSSSQGTVGTSAVQILNPALTGRKSVTLKSLASNSNTDIIAIGPTGSVTTANAFQLSAGDSVDMDIDATVNVYLISNHATVAWSALEVGGV